MLFLCGLFSCKKDNSINSKELLAYIKSDGGDLHAADITFVRTPVSVTGDSLAKFTAYLTRETQADVALTVALDESLVAQYNKDNKTSYILLPAENYKLTGSLLNIKAGDMVSGDSIKVALLNRNKLDNPNNYILPLSVKTITSNDKGVQPSSSHRTVFIKVNSQFANINVSLKTPPAGTPIDRSNPQWTVLSASAPYSASYPAANVLDGKNTTAWFAAGGSTNITLDMAGVNLVKGFVLTPNYAFGATYNPTTIEVLTSTDNVTWISQGLYTTSAVLSTSSATNPDYRNVNFYGAVSCRYIKFVLNNSAGYGGFAEISAIK